MHLCNYVSIMFMSKWAELLKSPYPILYQRWKAVVLPSAVIFLIPVFVATVWNLGNAV